MSKNFKPSTTAKKTDVGTTEEDRLGRTWIVSTAVCRGGGTRRIWKLQRTGDDFVLVEEAGALSASTVPVPEEVQKEVARQQKRTELLDQYNEAQERVVNGAVTVGTSLSQVAVHAGAVGKTIGGWIATKALSFGDRVHGWMTAPQPEVFEMVQIADLEGFAIRHSIGT
jgi:hypothetical protein